MSKYKKVFANIKNPTMYVYEANVNLTCIQCGKIILVNSFFARVKIGTNHYPGPSCRDCKAFDIHNENGEKVKREKENEYVYDTYEQLQNVLNDDDNKDQYEFKGEIE